MTREREEEIREAVASASTHAWLPWEDRTDGYTIRDANGETVAATGPWNQGERAVALQQFLTLAPTAVLELLSELDRLRGDAKRSAMDALPAYMSEISEECYCAGWLDRLPYILWKFTVEGPGSFGQGEVTAEMIDRLKRLAELCGGWFVWDDSEPNWRGFVPMDEWLVEYERERQEFDRANEEYRRRQATAQR